ncbi:MAG: hypothetical protein HYS56_00625 [Candidatus Omnitrophica bacterium]|nr:hypothetical protein [Candidatus Omnitrophota bacterium]
MDNRIHPKSRPDTDNQIHPKPRPGKLHLMLIIFFAIGLVAGAELLAPRLAGTLHGPPSVSTAAPPEGIQATPVPARRLSAEEEVIEVGPVYTTPAPNFETGSIFTSTGKRSLNYTLRGVTKDFKIEVYSGLNDHLAGLSRSYWCNPVCPSETELALRYLDQNDQKRYLKEISEKIESQTRNKNDQARIAISLVQKIPYDWRGFTTKQLSDRYPYEVVYDNTGVCGEKSKLLAFLLRELSFEVVLFNYKPENHMAVGIKCPIQYSHKNTGYCFVETARPTIITDDQGDYVGVGKLYSMPEIIHISGGTSLDDVSDEYKDAQEWVRINELIRINERKGRFLNPSDYNKWGYLVKRYGIDLSNVK